MAMTVDTDGKFLLKETSTTQEYTKELSTAGKYVDRNIKIDVSAQDGTLVADVNVTSGSASMGATGFTKSDDVTDYYVSLSTTSGSATGKATVSTEGWVNSTNNKSSGAKSVSVTGNGDKLYIPKAVITGATSDLTPPSVAVNGTVTGFTAATKATDYYVTVSGTGTKGSVKAKATVNQTGMVSASDSSTSEALDIAPSVSGSGAKVYIPAGDFSASVGSHTISTTPVVTPSISGTASEISSTTKPAGTDGTDYWTLGPGGTVTTVGKSSATGKATVGTAGYIPANTTGKTSGTDSKDITPTIAAGSNRYISKAVLGASGTGSATVTVAPGAITIGNGASDISGKEKLSIAPVTSTGSVTDFYIPLKATAAANASGSTGSISGSVSASVTTAGYAPTTLTGSGTIGGTATAKTSAKNSSNYYIPLTKTAYSATLPTGMTENQFTDISSTAPALVSGGYLYIKEGYNKNQKISLAKLVPDGASIVKGDSDSIISGVTVYDNDGTLITGTLATNSQSGALVPDGALTSGYSYYRVTTTKGHNKDTVLTTDIPVYQGDWTT